MNPALSKKLKAYSFTAGSLTAAAAAHGQIVYTDVIPDVVIDSGAMYVLHMNNDPSPEFILHAWFDSINPNFNVYGYSFLQILPPLNNAALGTIFSISYPLVSVLNAGDSIRPASTDWRNQSLNNGEQYLAIAAIQQPGPVFGNWVGVNDKFVGVRFVAGSLTHYGWVRLSVSADATTITLKEHAYNATPGQGIIAGQTSAVGITEQNGDLPAVHVYDRVLFVTLKPQMQPGGTLQVFNATGQVVYSESINEASMRISLGELASGVYLVQVIQPNGEVVTRKIYL